MVQEAFGDVGGPGARQEDEWCYLDTKRHFRQIARDNDIAVFPADVAS